MFHFISAANQQTFDVVAVSVMQLTPCYLHFTHNYLNLINIISKLICELEDHSRYSGNSDN